MLYADKRALTEWKQKTAKDKQAGCHSLSYHPRLISKWWCRNWTTYPLALEIGLVALHLDLVRILGINYEFKRNKNEEYKQIISSYNNLAISARFSIIFTSLLCLFALGVTAINKSPLFVPSVPEVFSLSEAANGTQDEMWNTIDNALNYHRYVENIIGKACSVWS